MLNAFKLYSGTDNSSHVIEGRIDVTQSIEVISTNFKESPPHSSLEWHDAPVKQYVITLSGTLKFTTKNGEQFILKPGDVLIAEDDIGSGHKWTLIDDQPWRRMYVVLKDGAKDAFIPKS